MSSDFPPHCRSKFRAFAVSTVFLVMVSVGEVRSEDPSLVAVA